MIWHKFPHLPSEGAHILAIYKGSCESNCFQMVIRSLEDMGPIEKWCYYEDYKNGKERKILNSINREAGKENGS